MAVDALEINNLNKNNLVMLDMRHIQVMRQIPAMLSQIMIGNLDILHFFGLTPTIFFSWPVYNIISKYLCNKCHSKEHQFCLTIVIN